MRRVLVLRALKLGDFLAAVPALRAIRRYWPRHHVQLACPGGLRELAELSGYVDEVVPVDGLAGLPGRVAHPEIAVNLHGAGPQSTVQLRQLRPGRLITHDPRHTPWRSEMHERARWCGLLARHGIPADPDDLRLDPPPRPARAGAVLVHPGAGFGSKRWPAGRFAALAGELAEDGAHVLFTGDDAERPLALDVARRAGAGPERVLAGHTPLLDLTALVAHARLVVSTDTGIAHLAYAFGTPSVTLFGPVPAAHWGPPPGPHHALSHDAARRGDPFADDPDPALLGVSVAEALRSARTLLRDARPGNAHAAFR